MRRHVDPSSCGSGKEIPPALAGSSLKQRAAMNLYEAAHIGGSKVDSLRATKRRPAGGGAAVSSRPSFLVCYLCGQQFGSSSLAIHQPQCYVKRLIQWEKSDQRELRGPKPIPPEEYERLQREEGTAGGDGAIPQFYSPLQVAEFNEKQFQTFQATALVPCENCGRTFLPDRLVVHRRSCKPGSGSRPVAARRRDNSAPPLHSQTSSTSPPSAVEVESTGDKKGKAAPGNAITSGSRSAHHHQPLPLGEENRYHLPGKDDNKKKPAQPKMIIADNDDDDDDDGEGDEVDQLKFEVAAPSLEAAGSATTQHQTNAAATIVTEPSQSNTSCVRPVVAAKQMPFLDEASIDRKCSSSSYPTAAAAQGTKVTARSPSPRRGPVGGIASSFLSSSAAVLLQHCQFCNRTFAPDRIAKHESVCLDRNKPPPPLPPTSVRASSGRPPSSANASAPSARLSSNRKSQEGRSSMEAAPVASGAAGGTGGTAARRKFCVGCGEPLSAQPQQRFCGSCGLQL